MNELIVVALVTYWVLLVFFLLELSAMNRRLASLVTHTIDLVYQTKLMKGELERMHKESTIQYQLGI